MNEQNRTFRKTLPKLKAFIDPILEKHLFRKRILLGMMVILIGFSLLLFRLFYLQIFQFQHYNTWAQKNSIQLILAPPSRGLIYDRNGKLLAGNTPVFSVNITPDQTENINEEILTLQKLLNIDTIDIERFYNQLSYKHQFESIPLKIKLSQTEIAKFYLNQYRFPGVTIGTRLIRSYPYAGDFASVLGYVGRINQQESKLLDTEQYRGIDYIGKIGLERSFESLLRGTAGYQQIEADAQGIGIKTLNTIPAVSGSAVYLTLDADLQEQAVHVMKNYSGAVVALDPNSGNILAMLSMPSYDPNTFVLGIGQADYKKLLEDPRQPLFNRPIRGQYPPGSTVKPIYALAGLKQAVITPELKLFDPGYFKLTPHSRAFHNWERSGQGWVNLRSAIALSTDTYFYYLATRLGIKNMIDILSTFGYGQRTGIQIQEELPGILPTPENKKKLRKENWYAGDTLNSIIGQGIMLVTPLQLAVSTSIIANRGLHYRPNLISKIILPNQSVKFYSPAVMGELKLEPNLWKTVIEAMEAVITEGTGYRFGITPYSVAAKTGTAQLFSLKQNEHYNASKIAPKLRDNSLFIGFAPVDHPSIVIVVLVQNNTGAAMVARQLMDYYLLKEGHWQGAEK